MFTLRFKKFGLITALAISGTMLGLENLYSPLREGLHHKLSDHFGLGFVMMTMISILFSMIWVMTNTVNVSRKNDVPDIFRLRYRCLLKRTCIPYAAGFILGTVVRCCGPIFARI